MDSWIQSVNERMKEWKIIKSFSSTSPSSTSSSLEKKSSSSSISSSGSTSPPLISAFATFLDKILSDNTKYLIRKSIEKVTIAYHLFFSMIRALCHELQKDFRMKEEEAILLIFLTLFLFLLLILQFHLFLFHQLQYFRNRRLPQQQQQILLVQQQPPQA
jgi:flagellar biogenesis protein FliO